eukprot:COSAG04_NODE_2095_length_4809_cov_1.849894_5_plen_22_part_01
MLKQRRDDVGMPRRAGHVHRCP